MLRALGAALLVVAIAGTASGQALAVLRVKVTVRDAARMPVPVARHALLISDNPNTTTPTRIVTGSDGTVEVKLRPGNYTVESDEPLIFDGKSYQWTSTLDVTAARTATLELTADNAEIGGAAPGSPASPLVQDEDRSLLPRFRNSLVSIWTPRTRATGFVVDATGLVVTSQRALGTESAIEVQLTGAVKVMARVLLADAMRDVAVLWIDPMSAAGLPPIPVACTGESKRAAATGQRLVALGLPLRGEPDSSPGDVVRTEAGAGVADVRLAPGSFGGPVFDTAGVLVGVSSIVDDEDERRRTARVIPVDAVCQVVTSAEKVRQTSQPPAPSHLPVEPPRAFPADGLAAAAKAFGGDWSGYRFSSSEFDIAFVTPAAVYHAQNLARSAEARPGRGGLTQVEIRAGQQISPTDFGAWSDYFEETPPVLAVRVTPRLAEGFWTTVARGAAYTQGVQVPSIKHFKPGFARLQAYCGDVEVAPIHPFLLDARISETDAVREGLYIFDPQALGPHCRTVKLSLYSEKDPKKADTRVVDPQLVERVWQDFASYRAASEAAAKGRP
jgi:Trypsin-like peptidase domain